MRAFYENRKKTDYNYLEHKYEGDFYVNFILLAFKLSINLIVLKGLQMSI